MKLITVIDANLFCARFARAKKYGMLLILSVVLGLGGCSTRLTYNYADWLIFWKVDDYVELNSKQQQILEKKVDELLTWHRQNELPYYVELLTQLKIIVINKQVTAIKPFSQQLTTIWPRLAQKVAPELIDALSQLSLSQRQQLLLNIKQEQQQNHRKWIEEEKQGWQQNYDESEQRIEDLIGELMPVQIKQLQRFEQQRPPTVSYRIQSQKTWLTEFSNSILQQPKMDITRLNALLTDLSSYRSSEHQELMNKMRQQQLSKFSYLLESITEEQQQTLIKTIDNYIEDFVHLSEQEK